PGVSYDQGPEALLRYQDRILYGSDFPNLIMPRETEIEALLGLNLPESFYRKVFSENARGLLASLG
ncbi:MAG: amidohydrolase family protein, partial [Thermodesulfobacteriota bacterium]